VGDSSTRNERYVKLLYSASSVGCRAPARSAFQIQSGLGREQLALNFFSQEFNAVGRFVPELYTGILNRGAEYDGWLFQRPTRSRP